MNKLFVIGLVFVSSVVVAAETNLVDKAARDAARAERRRLRGTYEQRAYGGIVTKPNSANGKVVFLNAQKLIPNSELQPALEYIKESLHPEIALVNVESVKLLNPKTDILNAGGKMGVALVESEDLPMLVTAPENGWAIVNVTALKDGDKNGLAHRVRLELLRGFGLAAGCAFMSRDPIALHPHVLISEDLDMIKAEEYGVFACEQIAKELLTHGVTPWYVTTYDVACREGWAHSPTNKFEQKVWDKIHALPKNPMKIEFDPKKGR